MSRYSMLRYTGHLLVFVGVFLLVAYFARAEPVSPVYEKCPLALNTSCTTCCSFVWLGKTYSVWNPTPNSYRSCVSGTSADVCSKKEAGWICQGMAYTGKDCTGEEVVESNCPVIYCE